MSPEDSPVGIPSLLNVNLLAHADTSDFDLTKVKEEIKWRVFAATVNGMRDALSQKGFNFFDRALANIYDRDLRFIRDDIYKSSEKYHKNENFDGYKNVMECLDNCRVETATVIEYYKTDNHRKALKAAKNLQTLLERALEYINPIYNKLNPGLKQQANPN